MKIKNDFVTNSSSTSYIVSIPERFDIHECLKHMREKNLFENLEDYLSDFDVDEDGDGYDGFIVEIVEIFGYLKSGDILEESESDCNVYEELINVLVNNNFCIRTIDVPSECSSVMNINSKDNQEKINKLEVGVFKYEM